LSSRLEDQRAGHCRHCGEKLPLMKRVKREEFCSEEHRELFLNSSQIVALDRLRETGTEGGVAAAAAASQYSFGGAQTTVAVAETQAPAGPPEPPDPPMAGTIRPIAVDSPFRMLTFLDGAENRIGQWEPVRPEPQWHNLALHFGLAEFYEELPDAHTESGSELARPFPGQFPSAPEASPVLPRSEAPPLAEPLPSPEELAAAERAAEQAARDAEPIPAPIAPRLPLGPTSSHVPARSVAPAPESVEIDTTLYLPGFSPQAEMASLGGAAWRFADWLGLDRGLLALDHVALIHQDTEHGQPIEAEFALALPLESCCFVEPEPIAEPEISVFVAESGSFEGLMEEAGAPAAPVKKDGEESGMSEAVQSRADISGITGLQALGERIASPFLHEPQPRPGTAKPRWTPMTMTLGAGTPVATEDWDIL
jgi:hypothetical protein